MKSGSCTRCTTGNTTPHLNQPHTDLCHQKYKGLPKLITPTCPVQKAGARCFLIGQAKGDLFSDWARKGRLWSALIPLSWVFLPPAGYSMQGCESGGGYNLERQETGMENTPLGRCGIFFYLAISLVNHNRPIK